MNDNRNTLAEVEAELRTLPAGWLTVSEWVRLRIAKVVASAMSAPASAARKGDAQ